MTSYHLKGFFVEACNCQVICPCWVDDEPDEDFCAGLFAWKFDSGSTIGNKDVSGRTVVSATIHNDGRKGGDSWSAIFTDHALPAETARLLADAFSGKSGGPLAELAGVTGEVRLTQPAHILLTEQAVTGGWHVDVEVGGASLIDVGGAPRRFDASTEPLRLTGTALHAELGLTGAVTSAQADHLRIDVAALLAPSIDLSGRSGMSGRFAYDFDGDPGDGD